MIPLGLLVLLEEGAIKLQGSGQMVEGLLVIFVVKIGFAELSISLDQDEEFFPVNIYKNFANSKLFNSHLYLPVKILAHEKFI